MTKQKLRDSIGQALAKMGFDIESGDVKSLLNNMHGIITGVEKHINLVDKLSPSPDVVTDLYMWIMFVCTEDLFINGSKKYKDKPYKHAPMAAFVNTIHALYSNLVEKGVISEKKQKPQEEESDGRTPSGLYVPPGIKTKNIN